MTLALADVAGFEVIEAGGGIEGVALARTGAPSVVLLDVQMPDLDGFAVMQTLRDDPVTAEIPVVFITASLDERVLARCQSCGARGVIQKPFDPMTLGNELQNIIEHGN